MKINIKNETLALTKKRQSNLLRFLRQHKLRFEESERKFLNDKHHEVSNFYGLAKIQKSKITESVINTQKTVNR